MLGLRKQLKKVYNIRQLAHYPRPTIIQFHIQNVSELGKSTLSVTEI